MTGHLSRRGFLGQVMSGVCAVSSASLDARARDRIDDMTFDEKRQFLAIQRRRYKYRLEHDLEFFQQEMWDVVEPGTTYQTGKHISHITGKLRTVEPGDKKRTLINVPPGTCKSYMVSVMWPCWKWTTQPKTRWAFYSYDSKLASRDSRNRRMILDSEKYQRLWGDKVTFATDQNEKMSFENTARGWMLASHVGTGTGRHPHYIVCVPGDTMIATEDGERRIDDLAQSNYTGGVLSRASTGEFEYRDVKRYFRRADLVAMVRVQAGASTLELTSNHPVYVEGCGYKPAGELVPGDQVLTYGLHVPGVWSGICRHDQAGAEVLHGEVPVGNAAKEEHGSVRSVREELLSSPKSHIQDASNVLQCSLHAQGDRRGESSLLQTEAVMSGLRQTGNVPRQGSKVLFPQMFRACNTNNGCREMRVMPKAVSSATRDARILQSTVCQQGAPSSHEWSRESAMDGRSLSRGVSTRVQESAEVGLEAGRLRVSYLPEDTVRERTRHGRPSHRLRQAEQRRAEPDQSVQAVSFVSGWWIDETPRVEAAVVTSVERWSEWRVVYNCEVDKNNSYFANGILVHNCDDPHNVEQALSEIKRDGASDWYSGTMSTRGVGLGVNWAVVMQRLHESDLSGHVLANEPGEWDHICLPEYYDPEHPFLYAEDWRTEKDELIWPQLFPLEEVQKVERKLNQRGMHYASGQLQQFPVSKAGGMFEKDWFTKWSIELSQVPVEVRKLMLRYWDRAGTKDGGDYTVGVLMGKHDGIIYVIDMVRGQWAQSERDNKMLRTAESDLEVWGLKKIWTEEEPGSAGKDITAHLVRHLEGFHLKGDRPTGSKEDRADPWASYIGSGNVRFVRGPWLQALADEHVAFPNGAHDDIVDSCSGGYKRIIKHRSFKVVVS